MPASATEHIRGETMLKVLKEILKVFLSHFFFLLRIIASERWRKKGLFAVKEKNNL